MREGAARAQLNGLDSAADRTQKGPFWGCGVEVIECSPSAGKAAVLVMSWGKPNDSELQWTNPVIVLCT